MVSGFDLGTKEMCSAFSRLMVVPIGSRDFIAILFRQACVTGAATGVGRDANQAKIDLLGKLGAV